MIVREMQGEQDLVEIAQGIIQWARSQARQDLFPASDLGIVRALERLLALPGIVVLVTEHEERVVAFFGLIFTPFVWNLNRLVGEQVFWWAAPDAPYRAAHALFEAALLECEMREAVPVFKAPVEGGPGLARLFTRRGLRKTETVYIGN